MGGGVGTRRADARSLAGFWGPGCCGRQWLMVVPPGVEVIHHQLHHEVLRPVFLVVSLQQKATAPGTEDGHFTVERLLKAKCFVEAFRQIKVFRRKKRTNECRADSIE